MAVVIPSFWHYIQVPEQINAKQTLEQMMENPKLHLAPRKYCDESIEDEDANIDNPISMLERLAQDLCHGKDFNHLIWDYDLVSNTMNQNDPSRFVLMDGGVIITNHDAPRHEHLKVDPYNSSLYKMAVLTHTPVVYVQKYVDRRVIPIYIHSDDGIDEDEEEDDDDDNIVVSDDSSTTTTQKPTPPKFVIQVRPPTLYLAQAIRISDGNQETTLGVAGTELSSHNLTSIMYKASDAAPGSNVPDCRNSNDRLLCYLVDTSGYVLGMFSNEMLMICTMKYQIVE